MMTITRFRKPQLNKPVLLRGGMKKNSAMVLNFNGFKLLQINLQITHLIDIP